MVPKLALLSLLLAGSACVPDTGGAPLVTKSPDLAASAAASPDALAIDAAGAHVVAEKAPAPPERLVIPQGPPKWRTVPREQNGFYAVLDGLCSELQATRVGNGVVVSYGGGSNPMYMDGLRRGPASFIALRDDGLESIGDPVIASPTGVAGRSLDDFWIADSTGSRSSEGAILHRWVNRAWKTHAKDQTRLHAWVDGGVIGTLGMAIANGDIWVEGSTTKPPAALYQDIQFPRLAAFPTGDVLVAGRKNGNTDGPAGPIVARHWAPGKKISEYRLDGLFPKLENFGPVFEEIAPDEIYAVADERIARWDGKAFRLLASVKGVKDILRVLRVGPDDLWVLADGLRLFHVTAAGVSPIATPEKVASVDGAGTGAWMVGVSGKLYKRTGEEWTSVPLPVPVFSAGAVFKAKEVLVVAPDDVLVVGKYWEKGPHWTEQELHTALFRTKPVKETLRCNEPDPENNNIHLGHGFQSWPPMATAECKTPFVLLARRSNARKSTDDWPRLRRALKGHQELGELSLVELHSGDRTFVGAKAKDLEAAKRLVAITAKADRLRPEIVCGDPDPTRTIRVDLATGEATVR